MLPPYNACSLVFLHQLNNGEKLALDQVVVKRLDVPKLPELAVALQWVEAMKLENFQDYMPSEFCGDSKTPRDFFYAVLCTLAPSYVIALISDI